MLKLQLNTERSWNSSNWGSWSKFCMNSVNCGNLKSWRSFLSFKGEDLRPWKCLNVSTERRWTVSWRKRDKRSWRSSQSSSTERSVSLKCQKRKRWKELKCQSKWRTWHWLVQVQLSKQRQDLSLSVEESELKAVGVNCEWTAEVVGIWITEEMRHEVLKGLKA